MDVLEIKRNPIYSHWQKQEMANVSKWKISQDSKNMSTSNIDTIRRKLQPQASNSWLNEGDWEVNQNVICKGKALGPVWGICFKKLNYVEIIKRYPKKTPLISLIRSSLRGNNGKICIYNNEALCLWDAMKMLFYSYFFSPLAVSEIHRMVEGGETLEQVD